MNKRIKSKNSIYVVFALIIIITALIFYLVFNKESVPEITLIGNEVEEIYLNEVYNDYGYRVINSDGSIYNGEVKVISNLDVNKVGTYEITYNVIKNNKVITSKKRIVKVIENPLKNVVLSLNGNNVEYVFKGDTYKELGANAFNNGVDISNDIIIEGNVDTSKKGEYTLTYKIIINGLEKSITRLVKVIDLQIIHTIDSENKLIKLNIYCDDLDYIELPDKSVNKNNSFTYSINNNGTYKFIIHTKSGLVKEYNVTVDSINNTKPTGYCQAILDGNSTEFKINDVVGNVLKYQYNNNDFYSDYYKVNYEVSNPIIRIYDKNGTYSDISCTIKRVFNNNMNNITLSTTLTPCNNNWNTYNNELAKLMQEAGYKTRTAVALAADYLARFDYKVAYSWGGKSLSTGINPKWGCEASVTKDVCTKSTGTMKCIYGMDCTGYTSWAFFQAGFSKDILRTSSQSTGMWGNFDASKHKYSFKNNQNLFSQIKPGDIVWTEGHVGIVIGTSSSSLKVANMREGIRISYINNNGYSTNGDKDFTHFVLFDDFFNMYGKNE